MSNITNINIGQQQHIGLVDSQITQSDTKLDLPDKATQQNTASILNQQKTSPPTETSQINVDSSDASLKKVSKDYANPSINYAESLDALESILLDHPKLGSQAEELCFMLRTQLNTSLTAASAEERESALAQFNANLDYLSQQGVEPEIINELRTAGNVINNQSLDPKTSEDILLGMLHAVMSNSRDSILADDFVEMYRAQRDFASDAKPEAKAQAERQLQSSLEIMKQHGVSQEFLNEMLHVEKRAEVPTSPTNVTTPSSIETPQAPEARVEYTQNQILTQQLMEKFPASNEEDVQKLVTLLGDSPNAVTVLKELTLTDFNDLMATFKTGYQSDSENATKLATILVDKLMPYPQLHDVVGNALGQIPKDDDTALLTALQAMHKKSKACSSIINALPKEHRYHQRPLSTITYKNILTLIKSEKQEVKTSLADLDILLCNTYFLLGEGKRAENLAKALPEDWLNKVLDRDFVELGVTGSDQLKQADRILHGGLLTKSARKAMINMLRKSSSDSGEQTANARLQALATRLLGIESMSALSTESLLLYCAKKYGLVVNDTGINAAIQALSEQAQVDTLQTTFAKMQTAQSPLEKPLDRKDVKGETLGYTVLTLQRALVENASELSEFDLASLGATPEDVKDAASLKHFVENVWINTGKTDWATGILLASYVASGESLENISSQKAITEAQKVIAEKAKLSTAERHDIIESLKIVDTTLGIKLGEGRTERGPSDETGAVLKKLCQRYRGITDAKASKKLTLGNDPITIGGKEFNIASDNPEELRQAIVAILNHKPMIIGREVQTYLDPVNVAHTILAYKYHTSDIRDADANSATQRIEDTHKKAVAGGLNNPSTKATMKAITADLSQTVGIIDKQQGIIGKALEDVMAPLLGNDNFETYILPLAVLAAQKTLGMNSVNEIIAQAKDVKKRGDVKNALSKAFQDMGVSQANANTLAEGVLHAVLSKDYPFVTDIITLAEKALDVYIMGRNTVNMFGQSSEVKSFLQKEAVRANTLKILSDLPNERAFEFSHTLEAGIDIPVAVPLSASVTVGKQDGIALWRDENGKPCISISKAFMAQAQLSASLGIDQVGFEASAEGHGSAGEGLVLQFEDNEKCADFMGALMSNTAKKEDLRLSSKVQFGTTMAIGGSVSASATLSTEATSEQLGVCTVSIGASASIAGDIQFERVKSGGQLITTSTSTINAQASVGVSGAYSTSEDSSISTEINTDFKAYHHVEQKVEIETDLTGTSLKSAKSAQTTFIEADTVKSAVREAQDICKRNGIAPDVQEKIVKYIKDNKLTTLNISLEHTLKGDINTIMQIPTTALNTPEKINAFVNNRENYEMSAIVIRSLEQTISDETKVGIVTSRNETKKSNTQTFTLKS